MLNSVGSASYMMPAPEDHRSLTGDRVFRVVAQAMLYAGEDLKADFGAIKRLLTSTGPERTEDKLSLWETVSEDNKAAAAIIRAYLSDPSSKELCLSSLKLKTLPDIFGDPRFATMDWLDLENNELSSLPPSLCQLSELRDLTLNYNLFEEVPRPILGLPGLISLQIGANRIKALSDEMIDFFQLNNGILLSISSNQIRYLPASFLCRGFLSYDFNPIPIVSLRAIKSALDALDKDPTMEPKYLGSYFHKLHEDCSFYQTWKGVSDPWVDYKVQIDTLKQILYREELSYLRFVSQKRGEMSRPEINKMIQDLRFFSGDSLDVTLETCSDDALFHHLTRIYEDLLLVCLLSAVKAWKEGRPSEYEKYRVILSQQPSIADKVDDFKSLERCFIEHTCAIWVKYAPQGEKRKKAASIILKALGTEALNLTNLNLTTLPKGLFEAPLFECTKLLIVCYNQTF